MRCGHGVPSRTLVRTVSAYGPSRVCRQTASARSSSRVISALRVAGRPGRTGHPEHPAHPLDAKSARLLEVKAQRREPTSPLRRNTGLSGAGSRAPGATPAWPWAAGRGQASSSAALTLPSRRAGAACAPSLRAHVRSDSAVIPRPASHLDTPPSTIKIHCQSVHSEGSASIDTSCLSLTVVRTDRRLRRRGRGRRRRTPASSGRAGPGSGVAARRWPVPRRGRRGRIPGPR